MITPAEAAAQTSQFGGSRLLEEGLLLELWEPTAPMFLRENLTATVPVFFPLEK